VGEAVEVAEAAAAAALVAVEGSVLAVVVVEAPGYFRRCSPLPQSPA